MEWAHRVSHVISSVAVILDGDSCPRHVSHLRRVPPTDAAGDRRWPPVEPATFRVACDDSDEQPANTDNSSNDKPFNFACSQPDVTVDGGALEPVDDEAGLIQPLVIGVRRVGWLTIINFNTLTP